MSFFIYINEPRGDDILCYFEGCLTYPLDDMDNLLGERFSHIG